MNVGETSGVAPAVHPFPGLYRAIPTESLLATYEAAPQRFARAIEDLSPEELSRRVFPGKWTIREIVAHVADSELCGALRIRLVLSQSRPPLPAYDQDRFAGALSYAEYDSMLLADTLDLFGRLRSVTSRLLRRATDAAWSRTGDHREWGEMTLRQLLELYADHGERHLSQILERRRAIGRTLALEPLLPERLY
jgi:uncharacterized damage-inducible protein DinB